MKSEKEKWIEWCCENNAYLKRKTLVFKKFPKDLDHSHCAFCWQKFGDRENEFHEGYYESVTEDWICSECVSLFQSQFQWTLV